VATNPPAPPDPGRYAYLVERLRTRRITMEEATELFALQQGLIRAAYQGRSGTSAPAPPPPPTGSSSIPPAGGTGATGPGISGLFGTDDALLLGLLALGAGAGLMAALGKHMRGEPPARPANPPRNDAE
jgi:hypothetical protein